MICYKFQKILFEVWFYTFFFHGFRHAYSPGAGADNPFGKKFWCQQEHVVTSVICCKFQKNLFEVWFYTIFFMILFMYIAPGQVQTKFWCQQKCFVTSFIWCKFQKHVFEVWFYTFFFHDLIHVYSPGTGSDSPQGTKFWCQQKDLITLPICWKFQRNLFEVWYMYIASGQGAYSAQGTKFWCQQKLLVTSVIYC